MAAGALGVSDPPCPALPDSRARLVTLVRLVRQSKLKYCIRCDHGGADTRPPVRHGDSLPALVCRALQPARGGQRATAHYMWYICTLQVSSSSRHSSPGHGWIDPDDIELPETGRSCALEFELDYR